MTSDRHVPGYVPNPDYSQDDWDDVCDNPELTDEEAARSRPLVEIMPDLVAAIERQRAADHDASKETVSLRLDRDVLAAFRNSGSRWQVRLNDVLKRAIADGALDPDARGADACVSLPG